MFNLQAPVTRQFIQHIASKFQPSSNNTHDHYYYYHSASNKKTPSLSLYSTRDTEDDDEEQDYFRYAPSSIYSADSFCDKLITTTSTVSSSSSSSASDSVFEKTYVSFPDFTPSTTSNRALFTRPEVMTATATPIFYNTPHSKPIWIV